MKNRLLILVLLLFTTFVVQTVLAETFYTGKPANLYSVCKNGTYVDSVAKLVVLNPNNTVIINNVTMSVISDGKFNLTFIPEMEGSYLAYTFCNISNIIIVAEESFFVLEELELIGTEINIIGRTIIVSLIYLVHIVLVLLGFGYRSATFALVGGAIGVLFGLVALALLSTPLGVTGSAVFTFYIVISLMFMFGVSRDKEEE